MSSSHIAFVSSLLLFATACGSGNSSSPSSPMPPAPTPSGPSSSVTIPMNAETLGDRAYAPDVVNIAVGDSVIWMNADSISHTSTSDAAGWDSGIVAPGSGFSFAFQATGTFRYHCAIHPGMVGVVVVR